MMAAVAVIGSTEFRALLRREKDFRSFYRQVNKIAKHDKSDRMAALKVLDATSPSAPVMVQRSTSAASSALPAANSPSEPPGKAFWANASTPIAKRHQHHQRPLQ